MQKLRLAFRGWQRRRADAQKEFVAKNASWGGVGQAPSPVAVPARGGQAGAPVLHTIDLEGLQVAYLDDSGVIVYYLDTESGEVVEARDGEKYAEPRYRRVPRRSSASDASDRREFVASLDPSSMRDALRAALDQAEFRRVLSEDRKLERTWYVFKNDRATAAIESWLGARPSRPQ
jgi:arylamine N-acetyltransferase